MKRILLLVLAICVICTAFAVPTQAADSGGVEETIKALGIMTGDTNGNMNLGSYVTRAEFAKMLVMASAYKDTVEEGTGLSVFSDVKSTYWAAEYIRIAVEQGWFTGYTDGTFRPGNTIKLEEAATAVLRLLGYSDSDLAGTFPAAQIAKYKALGLDNQVAKSKGQLLTRKDCMYIFYNLMTATTKEGSTYATALGYSLTSSGELDYTALVTANLEGPYTVDSSGLSLPFTTTSNVTVYKNGTAATLSDADIYDVYYYNNNLRSVYLYSNRITGTYTTATPSIISPSTVTVAGNTYTIGTSSAAYKLSSMGKFAIGDSVTLLLGMDGTVADVVNTTDLTATYYGVVTGNSSESYTTESGTTSVSNTVQIACTDGVVHSFSCSSTYTVGSVVMVEYENGETSIQKVTEKSISGTVNASGTQLGDTKFASDVKIIDTDTSGNYLRIYPSRLAGHTISSSYVRWYVLDGSGNITDLILKNATGDMYSYGILTSVSETSSGSGESTSLSGKYSYILNGSNNTLNTSKILFGVDTCPARFIITDGSISGIKNLAEVKVNSIATTTLTGKDNKTYEISEYAQVYLETDDDEYSLVSLSTIDDTSAYTLTAYYDNLGYATGNLIRVIIAKEK